MTLRRTVSAALVFLALETGVARAQEYEVFEGKNNVFEGEGGTRKAVDGVDFWTNGSPPTRFVLLGYVSDRRHKTGLIGRIRMSGLESDVARRVREAGGDAAIVVEFNAETVGVVGTSHTSSTSNGYAFGNSATASGRSWTSSGARAVQKQVSRFAVIKYLPTESRQHETVVEPPDVAPAAAATAGCTKDVDCKGSRVCERGACVEPGTKSDP